MYSLTKRATIAFGQTALRSALQPIASAVDVVATPLARAVQSPTSASSSSPLTTGRTLQHILEPRNAVTRVLARAQIGRNKVERSVHLGRVVKVVEVDRSGYVSIRMKR